MSNRDRIRKNTNRKSNSPPNQDSLLQHLLGRPFSNGSFPRYGRLAETNSLQTRPFTPPPQIAESLSLEEIQALLPKLAQFGYNGVKIPILSPHPTLSSPIQSTSGDSQVEDNSQQQSEILQPSEELVENEEISNEAQNILQNDLGEAISDDEEKESDSEQLTELASTDNPETQSQAKLDLQAKFSALAQFGYNGVKIPVFTPNPDSQVAISPKSGVSQVENNYQEKPQGLQSDEAEKDNEEISTEGEKIQFGGGVSGDEDNRKLIQAQLVAGESLAQAQEQVPEKWKNIDIPGAIAYNKKRYSPETTLVIQDTLILQRFLEVNRENYLGEFNEETIIAIAKWQEAKGLAEVDGKIGYGTRESLGITQRLFDDEKGYGFNYFFGQPFVRGAEDSDEIDPNDVAQGNLGNCYFAAGMMAVALTNPSLIRELIKDNGDGSYNVTLYTDEGKKVEIKVTPYFPTVVPGVPAYAGWGDEQELWPMLLEKAYAQYKEGYYETGKGEGGYDLIGQGGRSGDVVKLLTGPIPQEFKEKYPNIEIKDVYLVQELDWLNVAQGIASSLREHCAVTAGTIDPPDGEEKEEKKGKKKAGENGIYFNHSYVIKSIYKKGAGEDTPDNIFLYLLNPWGEEHINGLSMSWFMKYFDTLYINPVSQRYVAPKTPVSQPELVESSPSKPVAEMSAGEKIGAAISAAITKYLLPEIGEQLKALLRPETLALIATVVGAWAISHATGAGQVIDVILVGVGVFTLGLDVISVIEDLIGFAGVLKAQTQEDIDKAGKHLAEAIATVGVEIILQFLTHKMGGSKAKKAEVDEAGVPRQRGAILDGELTRLKVGEGHELIVTRSGKIFRCSSCKGLREQFAKVLEENPELGKRLESLETKYQEIAQMKDGAARDSLKAEADSELTRLESELNKAKGSPLVDFDQLIEKYTEPVVEEVWDRHGELGLELLQKLGNDISGNDLIGLMNQLGVEWINSLITKHGIAPVKKVLGLAEEIVGNGEAKINIAKTLLTELSENGGLQSRNIGEIARQLRAARGARVDELSRDLKKAQDTLLMIRREIQRLKYKRDNLQQTLSPKETEELRNLEDWLPKSEARAAELEQQLRSAERSDGAVYEDLKKIARSINPEIWTELPCFSGDTLVWTVAGAKRIDRLQVGELIFAFDFEQNEVVKQKVIKVLKNKTIHFYEIKVGNNIIKATGKHPFWVEDTSEWIAASELKEGMELKHWDGNRVKIESIVLQEGFESDTYNLSIETNHNYFVGSGVLVHNQDYQMGAFIIYEGTNPIYPDKVYVGQTKQTRQDRQNRHRSDARKILRELENIQKKRSLTPEEQAEREFQEFKKDITLKERATGIRDEDMARYLEQKLVDYLKETDPRTVINKDSAQITDATMREWAEEMRNDPEIKARGYCR